MFSFNQTVYVTDIGRTAKYMYTANGITMVKWIGDNSNPTLISFGRTASHNVISKEDGQRIQRLFQGGE
jgi:hypothetical protein